MVDSPDDRRQEEDSSPAATSAEDGPRTIHGSTGGPRLPLLSGDLGDSEAAEKVDELLEGFGHDAGVRSRMTERDLLQPFQEIGEQERKTATDFFWVFSRFEFALKEARYAQQMNGLLKVQHEKFASDLDEQFRSSARARPHLRAEIEPLLTQPPAKQVRQGNQLHWTREEPRSEPDLRWLLSMAYRVRNNLFHGGKYPSEPARNQPLLAAALAVLRQCLDLHDEVRDHYLNG